MSVSLWITELVQSYQTAITSSCLKSQ